MSNLIVQKSKITILHAFILVLFFSCKETPKPLPSGILDNTKMTEVMVDVQLLEGLIAVRTIEEEQINFYYNATFEKHGIDKNTFDLNINYYIEHPAELEVIYQDVITELSKKQATVQAANEATTN